MASEGVTIIVRKEETAEAGHHGGAWKVAYADFVTAMMAFFLLMWLLNATTEQQRTGLADYFAPTNLFGHSTSGSGKPFGGKTPNDTDTQTSTSGVLQAINGKQPPQLNVDEDDTETPADPREVDGMTTGQNGSSAKRDRSGPAPRNGIATGPQTFPHGGDFAAPQLTPVTGATTMTPSGRVAMTPANTAAMTQAATASMSPADAAMVQAAANAAATDAQHEQEALNEAATRLRSAIQQDPSLKDIADQLRVDNTPEGLRIQIVDKDNQQMFMLGNAALTARARELVQKVVPVLMTLPNAISIAGHTDAASYSGKDKTNWELSTDRANTTRRLLMDAGLPEARIRSVTGNADRDLLLPNDPLNAANRRISIVVLRHAGKAAP